MTNATLKSAGLGVAIKSETCHSCGNPICCNPRHLRFDTRRSNVEDMYRHGTASVGENAPYSRLDNATVQLIRERRANGAMQTQLAAEFGISSAYVSDIVNGLCWQDAGGPITGRGKRTQRTPNSRRGKAA